MSLRLEVLAAFIVALLGVAADSRDAAAEAAPGPTPKESVAHGFSEQRMPKSLQAGGGSPTTTPEDSTVKGLEELGLPPLPEGMGKFQMADWSWPLIVGGGAALLACQVFAIGYVSCCVRGRYEGRMFWYRGNLNHVLDQVVCCSCESPKMTEVQIGELQHDLRNGRVYWSGQWGRDYRFHVANFHPLISIFFCHPLHPFGKVARALVLAITVAFMVGWQRFIQETVRDLPGDWGEDIDGRVSSVTQYVHVDARGHLVLFFYVTLPAMLTEQLLTKLATLHDSINDFHREYGDRSCCAAMVAWFITLMGWVACLLFYLLACASLAFLVYTVYTVRTRLELGEGAEELFYFAGVMPLSLAQIWFLWWFIFDVFPPRSGFGLCHFFEQFACLHMLCWQWWIEEEAMVQEPTWRVADTAHNRFGEEVDDEYFSDEAASILKTETGLVLDSGGTRWVAVERVPHAELEKWLTQKMSGAEKGQDLLTQVEERRAEAQRLRDNECVDLVPACCCGHKRWLRGPGMLDALKAAL